MMDTMLCTDCWGDWKEAECTDCDGDGCELCSDGVRECPNCDEGYVDVNRAEYYEDEE